MNIYFLVGFLYVQMWVNVSYVIINQLYDGNNAVYDINAAVTTDRVFLKINDGINISLLEFTRPDKIQVTYISEVLVITFSYTKEDIHFDLDFGLKYLNLDDIVRFKFKDKYDEIYLNCPEQYIIEHTKQIGFCDYILSSTSSIDAYRKRSYVVSLLFGKTNEELKSYFEYGDISDDKVVIRDIAAYINITDGIGSIMSIGTAMNLVPVTAILLSFHCNYNPDKGHIINIFIMKSSLECQSKLKYIHEFYFHLVNKQRIFSVKFNVEFPEVENQIRIFPVYHNVTIKIKTLTGDENITCYSRIMQFIIIKFKELSFQKLTKVATGLLLSCNYEGYVPDWMKVSIHINYDNPFVNYTWDDTWKVNIDWPEQGEVEATCYCYISSTVRLPKVFGDKQSRIVTSSSVSFIKESFRDCDLKPPTTLITLPNVIIMHCYCLGMTDFLEIVKPNRFCEVSHRTSCKLIVYCFDRIERFTIVFYLKYDNHIQPISHKYIKNNIPTNIFPNRESTVPNEPVLCLIDGSIKLITFTWTCLEVNRFKPFIVIDFFTTQSSTALFLDTALPKSYNCTCTVVSLFARPEIYVTYNMLINVKEDTINNCEFQEHGKAGNSFIITIVHLVIYVIIFSMCPIIAFLITKKNVYKMEQREIIEQMGFKESFDFTKMKFRPHYFLKHVLGSEKFNSLLELMLISSKNERILKRMLEQFTSLIDASVVHDKIRQPSGNSEQEKDCNVPRKTRLRYSRTFMKKNENYKAMEITSRKMISEHFVRKFAVPRYERRKFDIKPDSHFITDMGYQMQKMSDRILLFKRTSFDIDIGKTDTLASSVANSKNSSETIFSSNIGVRSLKNNKKMIARQIMNINKLK